MCIETDLTVFALGRCMLAVESKARKLLAQIAGQKPGGDKLVDHVEWHLDQIDDLREEYVQLLVKVLDLVRNKRDSDEHRETAQRIETVFDQCRMKLWSCDKLEDEFKDVPVFQGSDSKWVAFREIFANRVLNNLQLNRYEKMAMFTKKVCDLIRNEIPSAELLEVQWRMLCSKFDARAAKYHEDEIFNIEGARSKSLSETAAFNEYHRHMDALNTLGYRCDALSEMLIGRLIQWKNPHNIELQYSKHQVKAQQLNIVHNRCYFCKGKHVLRMCREFKQLSFLKRIEELQRLKICLICFSWAHTHTNCHSNNICSMCRGKHNTMIHPDDNNLKKLKELEKLLS